MSRNAFIYSTRYIATIIYSQISLSPAPDLISKEKNPATGKTQKKYDKARTPYDRVLEHRKEGRRKQNLIKQKMELDPLNLQEKIEKSLKRLFEHLTLGGKK